MKSDDCAIVIRDGMVIISAKRFALPDQKLRPRRGALPSLLLHLLAMLKRLDPRRPE